MRRQNINHKENHLTFNKIKTNYGKEKLDDLKKLKIFPDGITTSDVMQKSSKENEVAEYYDCRPFPMNAATEEEFNGVFVCWFLGDRHNPPIVTLESKQTGEWFESGGIWGVTWIHRFMGWTEYRHKLQSKLERPEWIDKEIFYRAGM